MSAEVYLIMACVLVTCTFYVGFRCGRADRQDELDRELHDYPRVDPVRPVERSSLVDDLARYRVGSSQQPFPRNKP